VNRFSPRGRFQDVEIDWEIPPPPQHLKIVEDDSRSVLVRNDNPLVPFSWGLNPYRGCTHACRYCFARETHEYLGLSAGTDFERTIVIKPDAPALLEAALRRPSWRGEEISMSNVSDCYQPIERRLGITRGCLEVLASFRNPISITTRSPLIVRDLDLLTQLAGWGAVRVHVSIPLLDPEICRALEPGAVLPGARLRAISALSGAGVPVGISLAPIIPGLSEHTIPQVLQAARDSGARWAWTGPLRLPPSVETVFIHHLEERFPGHAAKVLRRLSVRDSVAEKATGRLFAVWRERLGFEAPPSVPDPTPFRVPKQGRQLSLFSQIS